MCEGSCKDLKSGGLLTEVGLLSSLTALSMKFAVRRCFPFLYINLGLYTKSLVCRLKISSALKAAVFG